MLMPDGSVYVDRLVTCGEAPGYRDIRLVVEINEGSKKKEVSLSFSTKDAISIMHHVRDVNRIAWRIGKPIDAQEGEQKPKWL